MNREMGKWERTDGVKFLKKFIRPGQKVLDFGARVGHYTIPIARVVGLKGRVYALDKDAASLRELKEKAKTQELENIVTIGTDGSLKTNLDANSIDVVLAYDVLHIINNRKRFYREINRILKQGGLFSVYPKHNKLDSPGWGLENMTPEDIRREIESSGFYFEEEHCGLLSHDESLNRGCVLNFRKQRR